MTDKDTSFLATISASTLTPSDPIVFDDAILNTGGHYDPTTGIYTVPIDGTYEFIFHFYTYNEHSAAGYLEVDNDRVTVYINNERYWVCKHQQIN